MRTDFAGRSFVFTNDPDLEEYQPLVQAFQTASGSPTGLIEPEDVAEVIWTAATDAGAQLRYIAGDGAKELLARRYSAEQDEAFIADCEPNSGCSPPASLLEGVMTPRVSGTSPGAEAHSHIASPVGGVASRVLGSRYARPGS